MYKLLLTLFTYAVFICGQSLEVLNQCSMSKVQRPYAQVLYPGDINFDVKYYKLDLNLSWRPDYLSGEVTIAAVSNTDDLSFVFIDLANKLNVDSILMDGSILSFSHENDLVYIDFKDPVNSGELFIFTVYYQGLPSAGDSRGLTFGEHNGKPAIYSLSEPYYVKEWWPCKDTPADKADSADIWLTVRNDLTAVSNGSLVEVTDNGSTRTFKWHSSYPIAHYLISAAVSEYTEYNQSFNYKNYSMPVTDYIYPDFFNQVKPELDKTVNMLHIFSGLFGDYPFLEEKYGHAQFGWGGGMEHQTISSMGSFNEYIISHELAHQWYGDKITCRDWQNIWLNEGFATYATGLYLESVYGKESYKNYIATQEAAAKSAKGTLYVQDISNVQQIFDGARSYSKGAMVLHMLRGITGDTIFFSIMKNYAENPSFSYSSVVTEDFQAAAESIYRGSLEYFFDQWVYGENFPKYKAEWSSHQISGDLYKVDLLIEQQQNDNPHFFTMPLQVLIRTELKDTIITIFNNSIVQEFDLSVQGRPLDLIVDPENYVMKEILYINSGGPSLPSEFILQQNFPNPFNSNTVIRFSIPINPVGLSEIELDLYDITGEKIAVLFKGELIAGEYSVELNTSVHSLSSGTYIYRLHSGEKILSRKMIHLK